MKLNRSHKRPLEVTIGPADRDPMFAAIWYDGAVIQSTPPVEPVEVPSPQWDIAPLPPTNPRELKWKRVVDRANEVNEVLKADKMFDGRVLVDVVCNLVDMEPTVEEIIAAYRRRMEAKRNG